MARSEDGASAASRVPPLHRHCDIDPSASLDARRHLKRAPEQCDPLPHADQPEASSILVGDVKTAAVVLDGERDDLAIVAEHDRQARRVSVLDGVADGFLSDSVDPGLERLGMPRGGRPDSYASSIVHSIARPERERARSTSVSTAACVPSASRAAGRRSLMISRSPLMACSLYSIAVAMDARRLRRPARAGRS